MEKKSAYGRISLKSILQIFDITLGVWRDFIKKEKEKKKRNSRWFLTTQLLIELAVTRTTENTLRGDKFLTFRSSTNLSPAIFRIKDSRFAGKTFHRWNFFSFPDRGRKVQTFVNRAALSGRKISPNSKVSNPPHPPIFFFSLLSTSGHRRAETGTRRRGGARLELTVKGRENCARWPFRNTMEINLSSLTNLRGHKATEDRGIALIITRSVLEVHGDFRGGGGGEGGKKRKTEIPLKKFPPLARLSVKDYSPSSALYFRR